MTKENVVNHPKHYTSHPSGVECKNIAQYYCEPIRMAIIFLWWCGLETNILFVNPTIESANLPKAILFIEDRIKQLKEKSKTENKDIEK